MITFFVHNFTANPERTNGFTGVRVDMPDGSTGAQAADQYIVANALPVDTVVYAVALTSYTFRKSVAQPNTGGAATTPTLPANGS